MSVIAVSLPQEAKYRQKTQSGWQRFEVEQEWVSIKGIRVKEMIVQLAINGQLLVMVLSPSSIGNLHVASQLGDTGFYARDT